MADAPLSGRDGDGYRFDLGQRRRKIFSTALKIGLDRKFNGEPVGQISRRVRRRSRMPNALSDIHNLLLPRGVRARPRPETGSGVTRPRRWMADQAFADPPYARYPSRNAWGRPPWPRMNLARRFGALKLNSSLSPTWVRAAASWFCPRRPRPRSAASRCWQHFSGGSYATR